MRQINRTIRVGITVGILFFCWYLREVFARNWRFRLFSSDHWEYVWREFKEGWTISTSYEWAWLLTVVLMVPIFLILWWMSVQISWRHSCMIIINQIKAWIFGKPKAKDLIKKKIKLKGQASHKTVRPQPMIPGGGRPSVKKTGRTMDAKQEESAASEAQGTGSSPQPAAAPAFGLSVQSQPVQMDNPVFVDEDISNVKLEDIQLPEKIRLEEDLIALLSAANYQVIENAVFDQKTLNYVGISQDSIILALTDTEKGDWLADEEFFNGEEPLWFSETSSRTSPVYTLLTVAKNFAKKLEEKGLKQTVFPILIEKDGTIINAVDMAEIWKKMGVVVCRTDLGGPEELPPFGQALPLATDRGSSDLVTVVQGLFGK